MKVSKIDWARCPHCKTVMNGYEFYPAQSVMSGESYTGIRHKCDKCGEKVIVFCEVKVKFEMEKDDE